MNKAKMTFRFSQDRRQEEVSSRRDSKVIPLRPEEYRVEEPPSQAQAVDSYRIPQNESGVYKPDRELERPQASTASFGVKDTQTPRPVKPLSDFTTDFGGWQSSFDEETDRVSSMIRSSREHAIDPETGYMERDPDINEKLNRPSRADMQPEQAGAHSDGGPRDIQGSGIGGYVRITRSPGGGGSFLRIVASVAGAVVTGVAFGFLVLSMFTAPEEDQTARAGGGKNGQTQASTASGTGAGAAQPGAAGAGSGALPTTAGAGAAVNLPARSYTILQGGVFSTAQSAETEVANFRKKGLSAVSEAGEKFTVFVGVAASRDESLGLSQTYKDQNIDVMLKAYDIPAVSQIRWSGKQPELFSAYMNLGSKLVQQIAAQTSLHVVDKEARPLDDKALQSIKATHQSWAQSASAISDGLGEAGKAALPKLNSALNTAVVTLEEYKKNPSASLMWQAQTAIMQYLVAEKELLKAVAVS
ncbi:stage II sporulation protein B [Paenibacillus sp. UNCCL117]|uniref:hypothetical protein n=1 Tax=unclassified Paenibacillus TaxID=185978 RepID=UPI0008819B73|nr:MULTISPECIES: hypothetical protein [unclassified Paenibacillus]SDD24753.1 stage II sporulation protein B [Paenibacillus sp. cl123]SFW41418.1 stage II sporulation protein B [Paenibacillus sp. UNCCL117]